MYLVGLVLMLGKFDQKCGIGYGGFDNAILNSICCIFDYVFKYYKKSQTYCVSRDNTTILRISVNGRSKSHVVYHGTMVYCVICVLRTVVYKILAGGGGIFQTEPSWKRSNHPPTAKIRVLLRAGNGLRPRWQNPLVVDVYVARGRGCFARTLH